MTIKERAESMAAAIKKQIFLADGATPGIEKFLTSQLTEACAEAQDYYYENIVLNMIKQAVEEAKNNQTFELYELRNADGTMEKWSGDFEKRIYDKGFSDAREQAVRLEDHECQDPYSCDAGIYAERIRAMVTKK